MLLKKSNIKQIYQESFSECGLACVCMLLNYFGKKIDIISLRNKYRFSAAGLSFSDLKKIYSDFGVDSTGLALKSDDFFKLQYPVIAHVNNNHFVVISTNKKKEIIVNDPDKGIKVLTLKEFDKIYSGAILAANPTEQFDDEQEVARVDYKFFIDSPLIFFKSIFVLFLMTLLIELLVNIMPLLMQHVIDKAIPSVNIESVKYVALIFLLLTLFLQVASIARSFLSERIALSIGSKSTITTFKHLMHLPLSYFEQRSIGDIQSRFSAVNKLKMFLTGNIISVVLDTLFSVVVCLIIFNYSPKLALCSIFMLLTYLLIKIIRFNRYNKYLEVAEIDYAESDTFFLESIRSIAGIKNLSGLGVRINHWSKKMINIHKNQEANARDEGYFSAAANFVVGLEKVAILYLGAISVINEVLSLGQFLAYIAYKEQLYWRATNLSNNIAAFHFLKISIRRLKDIISSAALATIDNQDGTLAEENHLSVKNISYSYSDFEKNTIEGITLEIPLGKHTVIIGRSGIGKSTLAKLLLGLVQPNAGEICIGGKNVSYYSSRLVGILQGDRLLSGTIRENITMFSSDIDEQHLHECMECALVPEITNNLKLGVDMQLGDMGGNLSGGQIQRILLARALYAKPYILVLDEATSHLDELTEAKISENISKLNITRVSMSHRVRTIKSADYVYDLNEKRFL